MSALPTAHEIHAELLRVAARQIATTSQGRQLAGVYPDLLDMLIRAICGNAAMTIRELIDAAIEVPDDDATDRDRYESACDDKRREEYDERHIESLRAERS